MLTLSDKTFDTYLNDTQPMLVMFFAEFAGPCNLAMPEFEKAASRAGNRVRFVKFDLDGNPNVPERYNVRGVPEFIYFEDAKPINPMVGALNCEQILVLLPSLE